MSLDVLAKNSSLAVIGHMLTKVRPPSSIIAVQISTPSRREAASARIAASLDEPIPIGPMIPTNYSKIAVLRAESHSGASGNDAAGFGASRLILSGRLVPATICR